MSKHILTVALLALVSAGFIFPGSQGIPPEDGRLYHFKSLNQTYALTDYPDRQSWLARARQLRRQILVSAGLWPLPKPTPLNAQISGRIERDGYSVEKAYFESYPGLFVVGNLYRPRGKTGPFPAVLAPHGHWKNGRFENTEIASVPGRAINFALQGYVVFTYSMLGYNESSLQILHRFETPREQLWGVTPLGIQLWNGIRALDFLTSLPDVDPKRIGVTGASGGGTQTFLLSAVDDRVRVAAPVNMISLHFQGGCVCENAPALRLDAHNVEIGALLAPRPLLLVSTAGDWTVNTPQVEFPAIRKIYRLFGAENRIANAHFHYGHNYNRDSREAVYAWFARWLQPKNESLNTREVSFQVEKQEDLETFRELPPNAVSQEGLTEYFRGEAQQALRSALPHNWSGLRRYQDVFGSAYRSLMNVRLPSAADLVVWKTNEIVQEHTVMTRLYLGRRGAGDRIPAVLLFPADVHPKAATLIVDSSPPIDPRSLPARNHAVLILQPFPAGSKPAVPEDLRHFATYNRTEAAEAVQDILTGLAFLRRQSGFEAVSLVGLSNAGPLTLLVTALDEGVRSVVADVNGFDNTSDEAFLQKLFIPLLRRAGDLTTAAALIAPRRLVLLGAGAPFDAESIQSVYRAAGAEELLTVSAEKLTIESLIAKLEGE